MKWVYYVAAGVVFIAYVVFLVLYTIGKVAGIYAESWLDMLVGWKGRAFDS